MTDPATALALFILAGAMVISVIGGGVWMSVRASNEDHPPVQREPVPEPPVLGSPAVESPVLDSPATIVPPAAATPPVTIAS